MPTDIFGFHNQCGGLLLESSVGRPGMLLNTLPDSPQLCASACTLTRSHTYTLTQTHTYTKELSTSRCQQYYTEKLRNTLFNISSKKLCALQNLRRKMRNKTHQKRQIFQKSHLAYTHRSSLVGMLLFTLCRKRTSLYKCLAPYLKVLT